MKVLLLVLGITTALAAPPAKYEEIITDYHGEIGIPLAARIKASEEAMDFDGSRIVGGDLSQLGQFPYFGGLLVNLIQGGQSVCGSTLLSSNRAVTAAHCWKTRTSQGILATAVFGSTRLFSGGTRVITNNVKVHDNYNVDSRNFDIAMLILPTVATSDYIKPIAIASGSGLYVGSTAVATGFGRTADSQLGQITTAQQLRHVHLTIITNRECAQTFGNAFIIDSTLCVSGANRRSTCTGDGGGPLVLNNQLVGITSFEARAGCERGRPAGFQRVTAFNNWIRARL
ncbi:unnamed protein product [Leptosia nina]|uniref:Peptidase S1 domain-containing protein n=1 Tax=Leptosia nina TaxID=320188 RepID=A0AAV1JTY0_9NEOP